MDAGGPYPYAVIREPGLPATDDGIGSEGGYLPDIDSGLQYPYSSVREDGTGWNTLGTDQMITRDEETYSLRIPARVGGDNYTSN